MTAARSITINRGIGGLVAINGGRATVVARESESEADLEKRLRTEIEAEAEARTAEAVADERKRWQSLWINMEKALDDFVHDVEAQVSRELVELALKAAEVILRRELPDRNMIKGVIRDTIAPLSDVQGVRIHLSPDDARDLAAARSEGAPEGPADLVEIAADAGLCTGDILIESRNGYFDARIVERLKLLEEHLLERCKDT